MMIRNQPIALTYYSGLWMGQAVVMLRMLHSYDRGRDSIVQEFYFGYLTLTLGLGKTTFLAQNGQNYKVVLDTILTEIFY